MTEYVQARKGHSQSLKGDNKQKKLCAQTGISEPSRQTCVKIACSNFFASYLYLLSVRNNYLIVMSDVFVLQNYAFKRTALLWKKMVWGMRYYCKLSYCSTDNNYIVNEWQILILFLVNVKKEQLFPYYNFFKWRKAPLRLLMIILVC